MNSIPFKLNLLGVCCFDVWTLNFSWYRPQKRVDREKGTYRRQIQLVWYSSTALVIWHPTNVFVAPAVAPTATATQLRSAVKHYLLVFSFSFLRCDFLLWQLRWPIRFYGSLIKDSEVKLPRSKGSPLKRKNNKIFPNFESIYLNQTKAASDAQKFLLDGIFFSRGFQMRRKIPTSGHH